MNSKVFLAAILASVPAAANVYHAPAQHTRPTAVAPRPVAPSMPYAFSLARIDDTLSNRTRRDARIEFSVLGRFAAGNNASLANVDVHAVRGAITLRGTVPDAVSHEHALVAAAGVPGVSNVRDELGIEPATSMARGGGPSNTTAVQPTVATQLDVNGVNASMNDGVVTLTGRVASYDDAIAALRQARAVPGVRTVRSELTIDESAVVPVGARATAGSM